MLRKNLQSALVGALLGALALLHLASAHAAEELVIGQVVPLTGTIAGTGSEYLAGGKVYFDDRKCQRWHLRSHDPGSGQG